MSLRIIFISCLLALSLSGSSRADVFLTAENLNDSLKQMQRLLRDRESVPDPIFWHSIGVVADDLATLLSDEVKAHGPENENLIRLALERTAGLGVNIDWYDENGKFYYDGEAYREYLAIAPEGEMAADCRFRLLTLDFYLGNQADSGAVRQAIRDKEDFIARYPDFPRRVELQMQLAIDYRDLWRLEQGSDGSGNPELARQVQDNFQRVIELDPQSREAYAASQLLDRFLMESGTTQLP